MRLSAELRTPIELRPVWGTSATWPIMQNPREPDSAVGFAGILHDWWMRRTAGCRQKAAARRDGGGKRGCGGRGRHGERVAFMGRPARRGISAPSPCRLPMDACIYSSGRIRRQESRR